MKTVTVLLALLLVVSSSSLGQAPAGIGPFAGTYAFSSKGASLHVANSYEMAPGFPLHWSASIAPVFLAGVFTLEPDGVAEGFYWIFAGWLNGGLVPVPWSAEFSELSADGTVTVEYEVTLPGAPPAVVRELIAIVDNGREMISIATQTGIPTATWSTTAHRIGPASAGTLCAPQDLTGRYLLRCSGLDAIDPGAAEMFASESLILVTIGKKGAYTGTWHTKIGWYYGTTPVAGELTVDSDCVVEGTLTSPDFPGMTVLQRGVLYDGGRRGYLLPLAIDTPFGMMPFRYGACDIVRAGRGAATVAPARRGR